MIFRIPPNNHHIDVSIPNNIMKHKTLRRLFFEINRKVLNKLQFKRNELTFKKMKINLLQYERTFTGRDLMNLATIKFRKDLGE